MSYCKEDGKDKIVFLTKEDEIAQGESTLKLSEDEEDEDNAGIIKKDGTINWHCPCLGDLPYGPCAYEVQGLLSCFISSKKENAGHDCAEQIDNMMQCTAKHPEVFELGDDDKDDEDEANMAAALAEMEMEREKLEMDSVDSSDNS